MLDGTSAAFLNFSHLSGGYHTRPTTRSGIQRCNPPPLDLCPALSKYSLNLPLHLFFFGAGYQPAEPALNLKVPPRSQAKHICSWLRKTLPLADIQCSGPAGNMGQHQDGGGSGSPEIRLIIPGLLSLTRSVFHHRDGNRSLQTVKEDVSLHLLSQRLFKVTNCSKFMRRQVFYSCICVT